MDRTAVRLHGTTDAVEWAVAFMEVIDFGAEVDLALMTTWFANAIEVGRDAGRKGPR